ncbi:MAG: VWA domain-containing protein [Verrucomicrobia bacterium]|nr:VWA domain-containing protein [Verrucomicrobiota bacterium]
MSFAWPHLFWLLLAPAALLAWDLTHRRRAAAAARPKILRAEAGAHSLRLSSFASRPAAPHARPRLWLCAGLALAIAALARPQWGRIEEPVFDQSREILLAVDLSRSMLTPDVRPSRLARAKLLIQSLLEKLAGERVGLVVFAGTAFLQSPLSSDYEILREFLPALGPGFLPEGGTNYRALIDTSLGAFGGSASADRFLIVLSDGEATDDNWKSRVDEFKTKGIRVIALGVGTAAGAMIPDGAGGLVKDERGAVVLSKLESATLQELAQVTGGVYRDASAWVDLAGLLKETVEAGRKGRFVEKNTVRLVERFQWPLAFGLWCLFVSFCYEYPVRPRVRELKLTPDDRGRNAKNQLPVAVASILCPLFSVLWLLSSVFSSPSSAFAAVTPAPPTKTAPPAAPAITPPAAPPATPPPTALARIVGRLSAADHRTARDWAELGRETVSWGSRLQSEQQPVPEGPVHDALAAVDLGARLDAKTADWPKLREELEALLKKPENENQQQQQNKDQQNQEQQNQEQNKEEQQKSQDQQKSDGQQSQSPDQKGPPPPDQEPKPGEKKPPGESAFGDMKQKDEPPPPPPGDTQKVGGAPDKKDAAAEPIDPSLALPLQKLDQLRNQDSPAQLFQLMEGERKPAKKPAKDW